MDSIIPLGQKNTLAEYMILSGADNRPPMLDKDLTKKYVELYVAEKIQADCDMKATKIILQGLPADIYSLVNHHRVAKILWKRVQLLMQGTSLTKQEREWKLGDKGKIILVLRIRAMLLVQGEILQVDRKEYLNATTAKEARQILDEEQLAFLVDSGIPASQAQTIIPYNAAFQNEDLDTYDSDCDDLLNAQAVLMANISNYGFDVITEENPEGGDYPFDLSKPLPLITRGNRQSVPVEFLINNDLKYLQEGISTMTYTTFTTKSKAAQYDLPCIEDMVPNIWSPVKVAYDKYALCGISYWREQRKSFYAYARGKQSRGDVYSTKRILAVTHVSVMRKHGYRYLEEIVVRRADNVLYKFKEGDFLRLRINDIEDMLLLVVQNRLINLSGDDVTDFAIALRMFTRSLAIQKRVKDLQLGVESYQKQINASFFARRHYQEYRHGVLSKEKIEQIGKEKSSFYDQGHQQAAKGKNDDDEEFGEICLW
nr:hypothetical protein [Tanacetum cinerariifolium]